MEMSGPYSENNCAALGVARAGPSVSPGGIYVLTSSQPIIPGLRDQGRCTLRTAARGPVSGRIKASRIENSHRYYIFSRKKFQFNKFMPHIVSHTEAVPKQGQQAPRLLLLVPEGSLSCHKASHNERLTASIASNNLRITIICDHC